jgi:hypothetical protein
MEMRALGPSGLSIAPLVLGGNVFGWTADEAASFAVLDAFLDAIDRSLILETVRTGVCGIGRGDRILRV